MEPKIGDIITVNIGHDVKVQITEVSYDGNRNCNGCVFDELTPCCAKYRHPFNEGNCTSEFRSDHKNIIFKEVNDTDHEKES